MKPMDAVKSLMDRVDALTLRERAILMIASVTLVYFIWDLFLLQPLAIERQNAVNTIQLANTELMAFNTQLEQLGANSAEGTNRANKERLAQLRREAAQLDDELKNTVSHLVPPREMTRLLEMVLKRTKGLQLNMVTSLGSQPFEGEIGAPPPRIAAQQRPVNLFKHGLTIEFSGDFSGTLEYLHQLEGLERSFFWDSIDYEVREYPISVTTISVFTVSMNESWIGV